MLSFYPVYITHDIFPDMVFFIGPGKKYKQHSADACKIGLCIFPLPSVEMADNDYILKRFTVDMLAKGLKESTIKSYMDIVKPFMFYVKVNITDVTAQHITVFQNFAE